MNYNDMIGTIGVGLVLLALAADYFAEKRGHVYTKGIETFISNKS